MSLKIFKISLSKDDTVYYFAGKRHRVFLDGSESYRDCTYEYSDKDISELDNPREIAEAIVSHSSTNKALQEICQVYLDNTPKEYKALSELLFDSEGSPIYEKDLYKQGVNDTYWKFSPEGFSAWYIDKKLKNPIFTISINLTNTIKMASSQEKIWYTK